MGTASLTLAFDPRLTIVLSLRQLSDFDRNGILRVSGAIPLADIEAMTVEVWQNLERRYSFHRNRPDTWRAQRISGLHALDKSVAFEKIGSPIVRQMVDDVLGRGNWQRPERWGSLLIAFPESGGQWDVPCNSWHLDFPASGSTAGLFMVRLFTCLAPLRHAGGATLVVAGSHLLAQDLIRKTEGQHLRSADVRSALIRAYAWFAALCSRSETADRIERFMNVSTAVDGVEVRVVEMAGEPGDVFLVHPLILHAASANCVDVPRTVISSFVYRKGVDASRLFDR